MRPYDIVMASKTNQVGSSNTNLSGSVNSYQEVITSAIGEIGRWQWYLVFAHFTPKIFIAWSMIIISFTGGKTDWWRVTSHFDPATNSTKMMKYFKNCTVSGANDRIIYDNPHSIVSEWGLICDLDYIPTWIKTSQMIGVLIGAGVIGQLGDWIGRQKCLLTVYTLNIVFIFLEAFSTNWIMMLICCLLVGFAIGGFLVINSIFVLEYVGTSWRSLIGLIPFWATGVVLLGGLYYLLPNWRHLYICTGCMGAPWIVFIWFTPESTRWLITQGKTDQAIEVVTKIAKLNKLPAPDLSSLKAIVEKETNEQESNAKKYNYLTLFKYKITRWRCPLFGFFWFSCSYSYYALTFGVSLMSGSQAANMSLMGVGEAFSLFLVWLISKKFGRKYTTIILFVLTSLSSFAITIGYQLNVSNEETVKTVGALLSRLFLSGAWGGLMLYTVEMFPTTLRAAAYGFVSVCARVGGIVAPQSAPLYNISKHLPYTINGILAGLCALGVLLLHDTYTQDLQDKIEEDTSYSIQQTDEEKREEARL